MKLTKFVWVLALCFSLLSSQAQAFSLFSRQTRCESVHLKSSKQFVLNLNQENANLFGLEDYSEGAYSQYRKLSRGQMKKLEATLNALNPEKKYTEKQKYDWSKEVIERVSELVGEDNALRQRAQMEFLRKGLDQYLKDPNSKFSLTSEAFYRYNRFTEIVFDNFITRWAAVPILFPQLRYKDLKPQLLKKILFEGYDRHETEVMTAFKETHRMAAFNKFARIYRKVLLISALVLAPVTGAFLSENVIDDASNAIVTQSQEAQIQSKVLKNVEWNSVQDSFVFIHSKESLEHQLGRSLTPDEVSDLKAYITQNPQ